MPKRLLPKYPSIGLMDEISIIVMLRWNLWPKQKSLPRIILRLLYLKPFIILEVYEIFEEQTDFLIKP